MNLALFGLLLYGITLVALAALIPSRLRRPVLLYGLAGFAAIGALAAQTDYSRAAAAEKEIEEAKTEAAVFAERLSEATFVENQLGTRLDLPGLSPARRASLQAKPRRHNDRAGN